MLVVTNAERVVDWPVTANRPVDGGGVEPCRFTARFKVVDQDALEAAVGDDRTLMREVLVGWGPDVQDGEGRALPFSAEARERLIAQAWIRNALVLAYLREVQLGAAAKNSATPSATGSARTA